MAQLGPFEASPHLAVGVSGGADSMALLLLADRWARARGGQITALTVDHGLRAASASEARQVARWGRDLGFAHTILLRTGPTPQTGIQAAARAARYALMSEWCRANEVLHLLVAHHQDDQAETLLHRLGRSSGAAGLAGMPPISEQAHVRFLRPLLSVGKAALVATLKERGQDWIEDPSNLDPAYTRIRLRNFTRRLAEQGLPMADLATATHQRAVARAEADCAAATVLAAATTLYPEGYCELDAAQLSDCPADIARLALARIVVTIAGRQHPPRGAPLERLAEELRAGRLTASRTLGGCRILPAGNDRLLVCREPAAARERLAYQPGARLRWDGRYTLALASTGGAGSAEMGALAEENSRVEIARLGRAGWAKLVADQPEYHSSSIPAAVRPSLPALWQGEKILSVPHLGHTSQYEAAATPMIAAVAFAPPLPLAAARFSVAIRMKSPTYYT